MATGCSARRASVLVEYPRAERWLRDGIDYAERVEHWNHRHYMAAHLAHVLWATGRWDEAEVVAARSLADGRGGLTTRITALHVQGYLAMGRGDDVRAVAILTEARELGTRMRELQRWSPAIWGLAETARLRGALDEAAELVEAGLVASARVQDAAYLFPFVVTGTRVQLARRDPLRGVALAGAGRAAPRTTGHPGHAARADPRPRAPRTGQRHDPPGAHRPRRRPRRLAGRRTGVGGLVGRSGPGHDRVALQPAGGGPTRGRDRPVAGRGRRRGAVRRGRRRDPGRGRGARAWCPAPSPRAGRGRRHDRPVGTAHGPRVQRRPARRRRAARTPAVAEELGISPRTASAHVEHILAKLSVERRAEIAAWVARRPVVESAASRRGPRGVASGSGPGASAGWCEPRGTAGVKVAREP